MGLFNNICQCCGGSKHDQNEVKFERPPGPPTQPSTQLDNEAAEFYDATADFESDVAAVAPHIHAGHKRPLKKQRRTRTDPRKITITGAVAAVPPCLPSECQGEPPAAHTKTSLLGKGIYLCYASEEGGTMFLLYSQQAPKRLNGVVAYICPNRDVATFHYTNNDGIVELCKNVGSCMQSRFQTDRLPFYNAWLEFLKKLGSTSGTMILLDGSRHSPPPKIVLVLFYRDAQVVAETETKINFQDLEGIGVLPVTYDRSDEDRQQLIRACDRHGIYLAF